MSAQTKIAVNDDKVFDKKLLNLLLVEWLNPCPRYFLSQILFATARDYI